LHSRGAMNTRFEDIFSGKAVKKRLTFNTGMDKFLRYVLEYLTDNYGNGCAGSLFVAGQLGQRVQRLLAGAGAFCRDGTAWRKGGEFTFACS